MGEREEGSTGLRSMMGEEDVGLANEAEQRLISTKATGQRAAKECAEESRDDDNKRKESVGLKRRQVVSEIARS